MEYFRVVARSTSFCTVYLHALIDLYDFFGEYIVQKDVWSLKHSFAFHILLSSALYFISIDDSLVN